MFRTTTVTGRLDIQFLLLLLISSNFLCKPLKLMPCVYISLIFPVNQCLLLTEKVFFSVLLVQFFNSHSRDHMY